jgi:hypothetical protein
MVNICRNSNFLPSRNKTHEKSSATKNLVRHANGPEPKSKFSHNQLHGRQLHLKSNSNPHGKCGF